MISDVGEEREEDETMIDRTNYHSVPKRTEKDQTDPTASYVKSHISIDARRQGN